MDLRRNLWFLFSANSISNFASGITLLAIPWYLVNLPAEENGIFKATAMFTGISVVTLFWGLYAGTLIDRYNRKRIFQVMQTVSGLTMSISGGYGLIYGEVPLALIALAMGVTICTWTLFYPNLYAICQEMVEIQHYKKINSAIELQGQTTKFIGMLVGPVMMSGRFELHVGALDISRNFQAWELHEILLLDSVSFLLSAVMFSFLKYRPGNYLQKSSGTIFQRLKQGFNFLKQRPGLMVFGISSYSLFLVLVVFMQLGMAMYVSGHLGLNFKDGAPVLAGFQMLYALGAVCVGFLGVVFARSMQKANLLKQIVFLLCLGALVFTFISFNRSISIYVIGGYFIGVANAGIRILRITYIIRLVPNHTIGRVNTFFNAINVLCRLALFLIMMVPFFSNSENESNIVYFTAILAGICALSALLMVFFFRSFDKKSAYG